MDELNDEEVNKTLIEIRRNILRSLVHGAKTTTNLKMCVDTRSWHLTRYHIRKLEKNGYIRGVKTEKTTLFYITEKGYAGLKYFGE